MIHLDDTQLIRLADGDDPADGAEEAARLRKHVASCRQCAGAVEEIRDQSRLVSDWLARADFEADLPESTEPVLRRIQTPGERNGARASRRPDIRPVPAVRATAGSAWLKAAVIVLLVAAPVAAFPGMRVWIGDQVQRLAGTPTPAAVESEGADVVAVLFAPDPGRFTVSVAAPPAGATLVLGRSGSESAVLRVDGTAEPVVAAGSVRIDGGLDGATYELDLPDRVTGVEVEVGDLTIRVTAEEIDVGRTVQLGN